MKVTEVNSNTFDEFIKSGETVIIDFYADWCMPCKIQGPILDAFAEKNNVIVGKLNVDKNNDIAAKFNVFSIPTLMLVKNGEIKKIEPGLKNEMVLENFIK